MSLVIRLSTQGSKNRLTYRVVVMEKRSKRNGKFIEKIGFYNPLVKPPILIINRESLERWLKNGAQLSSGVKKILNQ